MNYLFILLSFLTFANALNQLSFSGGGSFGAVDNPMASLNQNCKTPIGEINKYYVPPEVLSNYNILNFDNGVELIDIGYKNVIHKRYNIC